MISGEIDDNLKKVNLLKDINVFAFDVEDVDVNL
jgi:hypothetical protein